MAELGDFETTIVIICDSLRSLTLPARQGGWVSAEVAECGLLCQTTQSNGYEEMVTVVSP